MSTSWGDPFWPDPGATEPDWKFRPQLEIDGPRKQNRLTVALRLLLVLPHVLVVAMLTTGALVVAVLGWFAALAVGRLPAWAATYLIGVLALSTRVQAYAMVLTGHYPGLDLSPSAGTVRIEVQPGRLNRSAVLFRLVLVVPASVVSTVLVVGWELAAVVIWLVVLVLGRAPAAVFDATAAVLRLQVRYVAYLVMLSDAYPLVGTMGDRPVERSAEDDERCRTRPLALHGGARALFVVFLVLGVIGDVSANVAQAVIDNGNHHDPGTSRVSSVPDDPPTTSDTDWAISHTVLAYRMYVSAFNRLERGLVKCTSRQCRVDTYRALTDNSGALTSRLDGLDYPSSALAEVATLRSDILDVTDALRRATQMAAHSENLDVDVRGLHLVAKIRAVDEDVLRLFSDFRDYESAKRSSPPSVPTYAVPSGPSETGA